MDLTSATRQKTLTLLYLSEFLIDFYRIFRDLSFFHLIDLFLKTQENILRACAVFLTSATLKKRPKSI